MLQYYQYVFNYFQTNKILTSKLVKSKTRRLSFCRLVPNVVTYAKPRGWLNNVWHRHHLSSGSASASASACASGGSIHALGHIKRERCLVNHSDSGTATATATRKAQRNISIHAHTSPPCLLHIPSHVFPLFFSLISTLQLPIPFFTHFNFNSLLTFDYAKY